MRENSNPSFTSFNQGTIVATGNLPQVVRTSKEEIRRDPTMQILIFEDGTGEQIDVDLRGPIKQILKYLPEFDANRPDGSESTTGPSKAGRPKLGVTSKEVTLLPRHWKWLKEQKGGASVTIRTLVEEARRKSATDNTAKLSQESCYRFLVSSAGDLAKFEEATRAIFSKNLTAFESSIKAWPKDIRDYATRLSAASFS